EGLGHLHAAAKAAAEVLHFAVDFGGEAKALHDFSCAPLRLMPLDLVEPREGEQVVTHAEQKVHSRLLDHGGNTPPSSQRVLDRLEAQDGCGATGRPAERGQDLQGGGFSGAVRSQQAEYSAGCNSEAEAVYCANGTVGFDDVVNF